MNQVPTPSLSADNIRAFFHLPNPRIFILFIISSTATFFLGTALITEWFLYSRYHPGYQWIAFYAPTVIAFPIIAWIVCLIFATFLSKKKDNVQASSWPSSSSSFSFNLDIHALQALEGIYQARDSLSDSSPCTTATGSERDVTHKKPSFMRSLSTRLPCDSNDYTNLKRTFSV